MAHNGAMRHWVLTSATVVALVVSASPARADEWLIKNPGDHPDYTFEAEPHGLVGFGGPFKKAKPNRH